MAGTSSTLARRYAAAALQIALEHETVEEWRRDLALLNDLWNRTAIAVLFQDPKRDRARRADEARQLLGTRISPLALNLVMLLIERNRLEIVPALLSQFEYLDQERRGLVQAQVTSALPLTPRQRDGLREALARRTGLDVRLREEVDPSLLGGLVVRVGDDLIDGSVVGRLRRLEEVVNG